ncbi:MAG: MFS transporter [Bacteriovoracaceae bacterium]|nr:MFS transporter [Bacteroidota bacterium]
MSRQKLIIIFTVFVDVLGFGIVIPILPFYLTEFGASPLTITVLFSVFSFCAFLSAPLLGALSDRIGRRPVLLLSIFSTSIGWFVFASAVSIPLLFIGRMIDGLAAGNFTTAQSYLVDISKNDEKERVKNLGIIGATFGIGFILGPMIGGVLSMVSHAFPFYCAGAMALMNGISAYFFLEESNVNHNTQSLRYNPVAPIVRAFKPSPLRSLYIKWFLFSLAFVVVHTIFALFAQKAFNFTSFQTGSIFTIVGLVIAFNQMLLLNTFWKKHFSDQQLEKIMLLFVVIGLLLSATQYLPLFFLGLPFIGTSQAIYRVVVSNQAILKADPLMKGEVLGTIASMMTVAMAATPIGAGALFQINISYPFIAGAFIVLVAFMISYRDST